MSRQEWGFHYAGPREPSPDMNCTTCRAGATKECPTHGRMFANGCAHCASAQGSPCQWHWGLKAALDAHHANVDGDSLADYEAAVALVLGEGAGKKKNVVVDIRGDGDLASTDHREFHVEITARP